MNHFSTLRTALSVAALLALPLAQAATLSAADYKAGKARLSAELKADKETCASMKANAKDICVEQAKAKERVARAELEYSHTGKAADQNKVQVAKAESVYAVAKEKCDDLDGNKKDVCVKEAKAVEVKTLADLKMRKDIGAARSDAAEEKREADRKVATEKCEALAGDAKGACVDAAKARFAKP